MVQRLEAELDTHRRHIPERGAKSLTIQNYKEKDAYLHYEVTPSFNFLLNLFQIRNSNNNISEQTIILA